MKRKSQFAKSNLGGVYTLRVAIQVLDEIAKSSEPMRLGELAGKLDMSLSTLSRHVSTWRELGYLDKNKSSDAIRLSSKLITLAGVAEEHNSQLEAVLPLLRGLRDEVDTTVLLAAKIQGHATVLACLESRGDTVISARAGIRLSLPYSPSARIIWAFGAKDAAEQQQLMEQDFDFSKELHFNATALKKKLAHIFAERYDYSQDVQGTGFGSIACPVVNAEGACVASLTLVVAAGSMRDPPPRRLVESLQAAAARISKILWTDNWGSLVG